MIFSNTSSSRNLICVVCFAQLLAYLDSGFWPALLSELSRTWSLSNRDAGWITAAHYAAYLVSAPPLLALTDRFSSKSIYLFGLIATAAGALCFAFVANDLHGALASRTLSGVGEAGRFMVAVKLLSDHLETAELSRGIAWNALTIGIASAISFLCIDPIAHLLGWRVAYIIAACATVSALLIVWHFVPRTNRNQVGIRAPNSNFDLWPVVKNRAAMTYVLAYSVHTFESVAFRGWVVAFLAYVATNSMFHPVTPAPTVVATAMVLFGTGASFLGNEIALRLGRDALIVFAFITSSTLAALIAFIGVSLYSLSVVLVLVYAVCIYLDSATLTAGTSSSAHPARRGATLAVHSTVGYAGGVLGPMVVGSVLDLTGGMSQRAWGLVFLLLSLIDVLGLACFCLLRPRGQHSKRVSNEGITSRNDTFSR
jgi:MFS family permease